MSPETPAAPGEFRPYRRFVSWFVLGFVSLGTVLMLVSVAVTIYRRRHAVMLGQPIGTTATTAELRSCFDELTGVADDLQKHLEGSYQLLNHYDSGEVQSWAEAGAAWGGQLKALERRCGLQQRRGQRFWGEMAVLHDELRDTEADYTNEIRRFGKEQATRMDRLRERLGRVSKQLAQHGL